MSSLHPGCQRGRHAPGVRLGFRFRALRASSAPGLPAFVAQQLVPIDHDIALDDSARVGRPAMTGQALGRGSTDGRRRRAARSVCWCHSVRSQSAVGLEPARPAGPAALLQCQRPGRAWDGLTRSRPEA
jgi:hypothetical protein